MGQSFEEKLKDIITKNSVSKISNTDIKDESDLINDFGYDSVQLMRFLVEIENEFGVEFEDEYVSFDILGKYGRLKETIISRINAKS